MFMKRNRIGGLNLTLDQIVHQRLQFDGILGVGGGVNAEVPFFVDRKKFSAQLLIVVYLCGVIN